MISETLLGERLQERFVDTVAMGYALGPEYPNSTDT